LNPIVASPPLAPPTAALPPRHRAADDVASSDRFVVESLQRWALEIERPVSCHDLLM
jgi:hypothetical protein